MEKKMNSLNTISAFRFGSNSYPISNIALQHSINRRTTQKGAELVVRDRSVDKDFVLYFPQVSMAEARCAVHEPIVPHVTSEEEYQRNIYNEWRRSLVRRFYRTR